jgi:nucleoside-diphosphate-sugar epimerase
LPDVPLVIARPSTVLGDSRRPATTQFDLVRAFSFLASVPMLPLRPLDRLDVVPCDWVGEAIVDLHERPSLRYDTYHLSAGRAAPTFHAITEKLSAALGRRAPSYVPGLARPISALLDSLGRWAPAEIRHDARLLRAFWPYLLWDTVFENTRVVTELGRTPTPFPTYCVALLDFARANGFRYPYRERPRRAASPGGAPGLAGVLTGTAHASSGGPPAEDTT